MDDDGLNRYDDGQEDEDNDDERGRAMSKAINEDKGTGAAPGGRDVLEFRFTYTIAEVMRGTPDEVRALFGLDGTGDDMLAIVAGALLEKFPHHYGPLFHAAGWAGASEYSDYRHAYQYADFQVSTGNGEQLYPEP